MVRRRSRSSRRHQAERHVVVRIVVKRCADCDTSARKDIEIAEDSASGKAPKCIVEHELEEGLIVDQSPCYRGAHLSRRAEVGSPGLFVPDGIRESFDADLGMASSIQKIENINSDRTVQGTYEPIGVAVKIDSDRIDEFPRLVGIRIGYRCLWSGKRIPPSLIRGPNRPPPDWPLDVWVRGCCCELVVHEVEYCLLVDDGAQALGDLTVRPHISNDGLDRWEAPHGLPRELS